MAEDKIYASVLNYMCENYDYGLYATDFDAKHVSAMQRAVAAIPSPAGGSRIVATKIALQDFFDAIFQKVFVYEDEERLKIVKYFDAGAQNEYEDRQIHNLRLELLHYKEEVEEAFERDMLYMFDQHARERFELMVPPLSKMNVKTLLREQIAIVFDLGEKDIVIFLNKKIFVKHVKTSPEVQHPLKGKELFVDMRFEQNLWNEVRLRLHKSFYEGFTFTKQNAEYFFINYKSKFLFIIKNTIQSAFEKVNDTVVINYSKEAFIIYLERMLIESAKFLLQEVLSGELKAVRFLKTYSEGARFDNAKMKLDRPPLMDESGKIHNYKSILEVLQKRELLESRLAHKRSEIKMLEQRVRKSLQIVRRSQDEMSLIQKRRLELLSAIEKVEDEIKEAQAKASIHQIDINRLEFSKRDLLEAFKQVEVRMKTQENILKNTNNELDKWESKKHDRLLQKEDIQMQQINNNKEFETISTLLASSMGNEPLQL